MGGKSSKQKPDPYTQSLTQAARVLRDIHRILGSSQHDKYRKAVLSAAYQAEEAIAHLNDDKNTIVVDALIQATRILKDPYNHLATTTTRDARDIADSAETAQASTAHWAKVGTAAQAAYDAVITANATAEDEANAAYNAVTDSADNLDNAANAAYADILTVGARTTEEHYIAEKAYNAVITAIADFPPL